MCDNCVKHGEGKKWFLQAKNYSDELLADLRRRRYIQEFFAHQARQVGKAEPMELLRRVPKLLRPLVDTVITGRLRRDHFGQVVTLEEAREIVLMVSKVVRLPCVCRRITLRQERRYCLGFILSPNSLGALELIDPSYWDGPDGPGLEMLTRAEALTLLEEFNAEGLVHSVWTFKTPFIGGLCNCTPTESRAMLGNLTYDLTVLHPGESIVRLNRATCLNCGACANRCWFGALSFDRGARRLELNQAKCYGCGLCTVTCPTQALDLIPRRW